MRCMLLLLLAATLSLGLAQTPESPSGPPPGSSGPPSPDADAAGGVPTPTVAASAPAQDANTLPDSWVYQKPKPPPADGDCQASGPRKECGKLQSLAVVVRFFL